MKILVATGLYPPDIGGPATYTKMLEAQLPACGVQLSVAPFGWVRHYPRLIRHLVFAWKLIRESRGCDAIYALDPFSVGLPALLASRITQKPLLLRIAGDYAWEQGQLRFGVTDTLDDFVQSTRKYPFSVRVLRWAERAVATRAKRIVVPSEYMKRIVAAWGIDEAKITRIYSALHSVTVEHAREELRTMLNYDGVVVTTAARLTPWKGVHELIDAVILLRERGEQVSLVVVGDGDLFAELCAYVTEKGMNEHIRLVGRKTKESLAAAIVASDVFVLNTAYEGLSHQLLEVLDWGVPVVTTPVGGNVELISDKKNGLLVPLNDVAAIADAIMDLATNTELRTRLIADGRTTVKKFAEAIVVDELVTLLTKELG